MVTGIGGHHARGDGENFGIPEGLFLMGSSLADRGAQTLEKKYYVTVAGSVCRRFVML
jgi:hypothetical protein